MIAKQRAFIAAYRICASIKAAAQAAKIRRETHWEWMRGDSVYRNAFEGVQDEAAQALEDEAVRRAHEGVKRALYYKGKPMKAGGGRNAKNAYETEYSDQLLLALLKRFRPNLYREKTQTEVTGSIEIIDRLQAARKRLVEMSKNDPPISAAG